MIPKYMNEFVNELQYTIIKSLKRKGSIFKKGKFTISKQVESYIIKKFKVTKRMQLSNILYELNLNQSIVNDLFDSNQSNVSNFKIRLGRSRQTKYTTPSGSFLIQSANSFIHWEFSRVIQMGEEGNKISISNWNSKHESRILELAISIKKNKKLH